MNSFWPSFVNPHRLDELINQRLEGMQYTWELIEGLNNEYTKAISIDVSWGHQEDWQAVEKILTKDFFDISHLQKFYPSFKISTTGELQEGTRGGVVWLLPQNEEDIIWFRQNASIILEEAFPGDNPPPIILMLPAKPYPELLDAYFKEEGIGQVLK